MELSSLKIYYKQEPTEWCNLNTRTWHHSEGSEFEINFEISKLDLRFQINSNSRFSGIRRSQKTSTAQITQWLFLGFFVQKVFQTNLNFRHKQVIIFVI